MIKIHTCLALSSSIDNGRCRRNHPRATHAAKRLDCSWGRTSSKYPELVALEDPHHAGAVTLTHRSVTAVQGPTQAAWGGCGARSTAQLGANGIGHADAHAVQPSRWPRFTALSLCSAIPHALAGAHRTPPRAHTQPSCERTTYHTGSCTRRCRTSRRACSCWASPSMTR